MSARTHDKRRQGACLVATFAILLTAVAASASGVGRITSVEGKVEIGRSDVYSDAVAGNSVAIGDVIRTGPKGRVRLLFQDDSLLNIGDETILLIDEQVYRPDDSSFSSLFRLAKGKFRATISEVYKRTGARWEVGTNTAVAGVRGTEFIIEWDEGHDRTLVIGMSGLVGVRGRTPGAGDVAVDIGQQLATAVVRGGVPSIPTELEEEIFRQFLEGLEFIGGGAAVSLASSNSDRRGESVYTDDRAKSVAEHEGPDYAPGSLYFDLPDASTLLGEPPAALAPLIEVGIPF